MSGKSSEVEVVPDIGSVKLSVSKPPLPSFNNQLLRDFCTKCFVHLSLTQVQAFIKSHLALVVSCVLQLRFCSSIKCITVATNSTRFKILKKKKKWETIELHKCKLSLFVPGYP